VTSTTAMVRWSAFKEAAEYSRSRSDLCVGVHLDLGEWTRDGSAWIPVYEVVDLSDATAVADEVRRQIDVFRKAVGREPSHIDSHQHVHRRRQVLPIVSAIAAEVGVPLRHFTPGISYRGGFYGQSEKGYPLADAVSFKRLVHLLESLSEPVTEMACHPGLNVEINTMYRHERDWEVETLTDPRLPEVLDSLGIRLYTFRDFANDVSNQVSIR